MTTTRRAALRMLGVSSVAAAAAGAAAAGGTAWADAAPGAEPEAAAGSASARVPKDLRPGGELDRVITEQEALDNFSGSLLITHHGRTVLARSCGWANKARGIRNSPDTLFGLASVAKVFTGVAISQLAQAGKLRYSDTVGTHLSGFSAEVANQVTIHHLLTHSSGLGDYMGLPEYHEASRTWDRMQQVWDGIGAFVRTEKLAFPPGVGNTYSNSAYHVLNEIIAKVSGRPLETYFRENVYGPAGMSRTGAYTRPQLLTDRGIAHPYARVPGSAERVDRLDNEGFAPGAYSTCAEMARFARMLWQAKLMNRAYTDLTLSGKIPGTGFRPGPGAPPGPPPILFQSYGLLATLLGADWTYGHNGGSSNGAATELSFFPRTGYALVILSNYETESTRPVGSLARRLIAAA
ncbi:serine hydrolase domain-containing protein [Yinghuangia soli]|uniref:Beta-lactamase family protein n=1 Tax=Yinghuangia soli TaxID=2908204 RepID=A0AA41TXZ7_9ACTN|nr:serine hydrolase domain-containing protein [Yinghuangia soli]MCF2527338.1 beta-lactamase family protein [Yinghuangia soli]